MYQNVIGQQALANLPMMVEVPPSQPQQRKPSTLNDNHEYVLKIQAMFRMSYAKAFSYVLRAIQPTCMEHGGYVTRYCYNGECVDRYELRKPMAHVKKYPALEN